MAKRERRESVCVELLFVCVLKAEASRGLALRLRNMCQIIGRLVQRMPPKGSKTEYAPKGT